MFGWIKRLFQSKPIVEQKVERPVYEGPSVCSRPARTEGWVVTATKKQSPVVPPLKRPTPVRRNTWDTDEDRRRRDDGSDFVTGMVVGAMIHDALDHSTPVETERFSGGGGSFGGGGASSSWDDSSSSSSSSYESSYDSGSSSDYSSSGSDD